MSAADLRNQLRERARDLLLRLAVDEVSCGFVREKLRAEGFPVAIWGKIFICSGKQISNAEWDAQIANDAECGKLDFLSREVDEFIKDLPAKPEHE